jgi:hypothetical protein
MLLLQQNRRDKNKLILKRGDFRVKEITPEVKKEAYEKPELTKEGHLRDAAGTVKTI